MENQSLKLQLLYEKMELLKKDLSKVLFERAISKDEDSFAIINIKRSKIKAEIARLMIQIKKIESEYGFETNPKERERKK